MCGFSNTLILKGIMTFQSERGHAFCSTKKIKFNKNETELKMENPTQFFRETDLVFQLQLI